MRKTLLSVLLFATNAAFASPSWIGPFLVDEVSSWTHQGKAITSVKVQYSDRLHTGCSTTDQQKMMSYWKDGEPDRFNGHWLTMLMAAQAQDKGVYLYIDESQCTSWGGVLITGVKIEKGFTGPYIPYSRHSPLKTRNKLLGTLTPK